MGTANKITHVVLSPSQTPHGSNIAGPKKTPLQSMQVELSIQNK